MPASASEPARTASAFPLPATREQFPQTPVEVLACGVLVDLLIRLPGGSIQDYREMLGLVLRPDNIRKLTDPSERDALAAVAGSLPEVIGDVSGNEPSWSEVFWTLKGNDSLEPVEFGDLISLQPGGEAEEVRNHFGSLSDEYMVFALVAIKRYQDNTLEFLSSEDRDEIEAENKTWTAATES